MKKRIGKFHRKETGLLSYEILTPYDDVFFEIVFKVGNKFYFKHYFDFLAHQCYATLNRDNLQIRIGWHQSCGIYVESSSKEGDPVVREIGAYLNSILEELKWAQPSA
jgi:hypothetical protein